MHGKRILYQLIFIFLMIVPAVAGTEGNAERQATIDELTATTTEKSLIVFGTLENSFTSEMIEILHSGIALRFSFFVELYKATDKWPKELVATRTFQHIMTFDTLKENYKVTLEEDNNTVLSFRSLFEAQKVINDINGVKIVDLKQLLPDNRYSLRIRAELYQKTLPLSLHNILPFLSWWDVKTDWHSITFTYQAS
ncbi:DUF4390 domain-containing protein [Desulfopila sp. IMCC35006]|uniref:DUF4390 domain-containing protein n=1 Tax=Desulfopila sp. IMCC35006 TaxID=2569542 RepID=UPI0010AC10BF|nr:DUF4390 domain-containing protein [Desulfopila sp. IMCC35006]TKB28174.1 DUF4390 domain-containing protein [Desulfopila sp. IMCC35006]